MGSYSNGHFPKAFLSSVCDILCLPRLSPCYQAQGLKGETPVIELWTCAPHCGWLKVRNAEEEWAGQGKKVEKGSGVQPFTQISDIFRLQPLSQKLVNEFDIQTRVDLQLVCLYLNSNLNKSLQTSQALARKKCLITFCDNTQYPHYLVPYLLSLFSWCIQAYVRIHPNTLCFTSMYWTTG